MFSKMLVGLITWYSNIDIYYLYVIGCLFSVRPDSAAAQGLSTLTPRVTQSTTLG